MDDFFWNVLKLISKFSIVILHSISQNEFMQEHM